MQSFVSFLIVAEREMFFTFIVFKLLFICLCSLSLNWVGLCCEIGSNFLSYPSAFKSLHKHDIIRTLRVKVAMNYR